MSSRLHNHYITHPKQLFKGVAVGQLLRGKELHILLPPVSLISLWTNLPAACVNVLKVTQSLGARCHPQSPGWAPERGS